MALNFDLNLLASALARPHRQIPPPLLRLYRAALRPDASPRALASLLLLARAITLTTGV
ncbi:MAG TPA: hypothetical protein VN690_12565 [Terriglobales bacterium]|nr:hypothetical protein [Terriglobales bacterium]